MKLSVLYYVGLGALLGYIVYMIYGCGGPSEVAYTALDVAAETVNEVDQLSAREAIEALAAARAAIRELDMTPEEKLQEYLLREAPWRTLRDIIEFTTDMLYAAERALAAWEQGDGDGNFLAFAACVLSGLERMLVAATRVGLDLPAAVNRAVELIGQVAGDRCPIPSMPPVADPVPPLPPGDVT